ncbi:hypothetical protein cyc_07614 [Cyclospora cayetanensis]|nr:hypothetical protein cyc_07614 [Cyclospora cayetanensis]
MPLRLLVCSLTASYRKPGAPGAPPCLAMSIPLTCRVLLLLVEWTSAAATAAAVIRGKYRDSAYPAFLGVSQGFGESLPCTHSPLRSHSSLLLPHSHLQAAPVSSAASEHPPASTATARNPPEEIPLLNFVDWGKGGAIPQDSGELLLQQQSSGSNDICGVLYCTAWDPRSKALVSALGLLHQEALGAHGDFPSHGGEEIRLPLYPITGVRVTNSLVIARGRRALLKQRRMACNMKQLRHNERALRFMLQQQPPLQLQGVPALQLYTWQRQCQQEENEAQKFPSQLLEIRSAAPAVLQHLGRDTGALVGAWGDQGPPGGLPEVEALGVWLRRLGHLYEEELRQIVQERLQQAEDEYPIYKSYKP